MIGVGYDSWMTSKRDTSQEIMDRCRAMGFALAGVCEAQPTAYEQELKDWLAAGKHGEMAYMNRNVTLRIDPCAMVPGAKSVICVADRYSPLPLGEGLGVRACVDDINQFDPPSPRPSPEGRGSETAFGRIARYARGDDYHTVMRKRLARLCKELHTEHPSHTFRACVDTAPILEREHAQRAGLGAVGKNTLLIQRGIGSYLLLGEIITTLPLAASRSTEPDPCSTCTRCIDACPTDAITPWSVDATKCISYLTIEHRSVIDPQLHEAMGDWIFGCDVCQEVCPHNQPTLNSTAEMVAIHSAYQSRRSGFDLLEVLNWDEAARQQAFMKSSMKRAKLNMMKRNALIAAGNIVKQRSHPVLRNRIEELANDDCEDELVRTTARQVCARLSGTLPVD